MFLHFNIYLTVFCSPLTTIENGNVTYTTLISEEGYIVDTLAELHCNPGYKTSAYSPESRKCNRSGEWDGQAQTCVESNEIKIF